MPLQESSDKEAQIQKSCKVNNPIVSSCDLSSVTFKNVFFIIGHNASLSFGNFKIVSCFFSDKIQSRPVGRSVNNS